MGVGRQWQGQDRRASSHTGTLVPSPTLQALSLPFLVSGGPWGSGVLRQLLCPCGQQETCSGPRVGMALTTCTAFLWGIPPPSVAPIPAVQHSTSSSQVL